MERQLCGLVVSDPLSSEAATRNHTDFNHTGWYVGDIVFCIQWVFVYLSVADKQTRTPPCVIEPDHLFVEHLSLERSVSPKL